MKTSVKNLREMLNRAFKNGYKESINRERRKKRGYDEAEADVSGDVAYTDLPEGKGCGEDWDMEEEGVSQSKRSAHGYDLEEPVDYDVPGEGLGEAKKKLREAEKNPKKSLAGMQMRAPKASVAPHLQRTQQATRQLASIDDKISTLNSFIDDLVDTFGSDVDVNKVTTWLTQKAREVQQSAKPGMMDDEPTVRDRPPMPMDDEPTVRDRPPMGMDDEPTVKDKPSKMPKMAKMVKKPAGAKKKKEVNEPEEEPERKRKRAMSHADERGHKEEIPMMGEVTPPGSTDRGKSYEKVVKALKQNRDVDNPWAVAWSMKKKQGE